MKRICHVTSAHQSNDTRIFYKECVSLAKKEDYMVFLVAPGDSRIEKGVQVIGVGEKPDGRIKRMCRFARSVINEAIKVDADIYHFHDPELIRFAKRFKALGKKVIFDSHEEYYDQIKSKEYLPHIMRNTIAEIYMTIENKACDYFDAVIATCEIDGKHPYADRVLDCVFIDNFPIIDFDENEIVPYERRRDGVGCIGSLSESRGITNLIQACDSADVRLVLGGTFRPADYERTIKAMPSYKNVDYRGFCSRQEIFDIYNSVTIGASTILNIGQYYKANNLPTKVHEFMMFSLPCVLSNTDYNRRIVEKYNIGVIVDPDNIEDIKAAVKYLVDNKDIAKQMGENGRKLVTSMFNWSNEEQKLYELYARLFR